MSWKCEKCLHYVADKVKHDCINDEHDKLKSENARLKEKLNVAVAALIIIEDLEPINERQRRTVSREALKQIRDDKDKI